MNNVLKSTKGITLIALVITIIVLLILAGVSIAMLTGENGILTQAQRSKEQTSIAEEKELIALAYNAIKAEEKGGAVTTDKLDKELEKDGADATQEGTNIKVTFRESRREYIIDENGNITEGTGTTPPAGDDNTATVGEIVQPGEGNKEYTNGGSTAIIPEGFMIVPGLDNIEEGLVISDNPTDTEEEGKTLVAEGNQFVWVPVPVFTEFKREHFGTDDQKWWTGTFVTDQMSTNNMYEQTANGTDSTTEVEKMYKSVNDNKGFYIGRYEAGTETERNENSTIEDEVLSKKNKFVYNYIGWNNDGTMTGETSELGGAVEKARSFSTESGHTNVTSTLVYGVQWDAVMRWISEDGDLARYLTNSDGKGNYYDNDSTNNPAKTGAVENYQLKNIYDMAGNVWEWTMEADSTDNRVLRGGTYSSYGSNNPVSLRNTNSPDITDRHLGFRLAFFV